MATIHGSRHDVAISAYHRTIGPAFFILSPGQDLYVYAENALGTDELYSSIDDAQFPSSPELFENVLGHLIDIMIYTLQTGLEVYIHEGVHRGSSTWVRSDAFVVTPGVGAYERGFRVSSAGWRIRITNAGASTAFGDLGIRISTM